ncbi:MAG TPA: hypothetical protein PL001_00565 [Candidatus Kryptobacter bacterium]|nr:hypothetical protein [Candidatus Kryptobacter bacterium]
MNHRQILVAVATLLSAVAVAFAGPPFRTDDPIPVPYMHGELYLFSTGVVDGTGTSGFGPAVEFNYGILPNAQFHLVAPMAYDAPKGGTSYAGYGDTEVGVKYRFVEQSEYIPDIGLFPLVEVPTGNAAKRLGNGKTQLYLPVWLQKDIGNWTIYGGGGYWFNPGPENKNWDFSGVLVQYNFSDVLFLGAEIFHQTASTVNASGYTGIHIGGSVPVAKNYEILFSGDAGNGITSYKHFGYYLGLYHTF